MIRPARVDAQPSHTRARTRGGPIEKLRELRDVARRGEPIPADLAQWFDTAIALYEAEAAVGMTMDRALGLVPKRGAKPWWVGEARERRDEAIRQLRGGYYSDLEIAEGAREIARQLRRPRRPGDLPRFDEREVLITVALQNGLGTLSARRIEEILRDEIG
jgi:hypothetical protein